MSAAPAARTARRVHIALHGVVQGVGFRPWLWHCARDLGLAGWVRNAGGALLLEVEGEPSALESLLARLDRPPGHARITRRDITEQAPVGASGFRILEGIEVAVPVSGWLPDLAACAECLREAADPAERRYRYPFGSCTRCGPRHSIITELPWARTRTSMAAFPPCADCAREYHDPANRRFHAETLACATCGPQLALHAGPGEPVARGDEALRTAAGWLHRGRVLAVKGLAGYHLIVAASDEAAVARLRVRKCRPAKPFALMFANLESVRASCRVNASEAGLLTGAAAPIVLLERLASHAGAAALAPSIAPGSPLLGVMLAPTPLHWLLLDDLGGPVVATSGNPGGEPLICNDAEALAGLRGIADGWLVHDRQIVSPAEDSIVRVVAGAPMLLRRARGEAPAVVADLPGADGLLALGAQQKSAPALAAAGEVVVDTQLGDLATPRSRERFARSLADLARLHRVTVRHVACDLHPDYFSTHHAEQTGLPLTRVQHHHAHVLAVMAEHRLAAPLLGVAWDGSGYGPDGTLWGGEFLEIRARGFRRVGRLRRFRLPGGEQAVREPRRAALGLLQELLGTDWQSHQELSPVREFTPPQRQVLAAMLGRGVNAPLTSSAGRLFDGVAALLDLCQVASYEAEAATRLEWSAATAVVAEPLTFVLRPGRDVPWVLDWEPALRMLLDGLASGRPPALLAAGFHRGLAEGLVELARLAGARRVVLAGGCFQNRLLTEQSITGLRAAGIMAWWPQRLPPNDGGLALGQLVRAWQLYPQVVA